MDLIEAINKMIADNEKQLRTDEAVLNLHSKGK